MIMIANWRVGAVLALATGLCCAAAFPALSQNFGFRYDGDERGNIEGKRASCEVYAKVAQVQAEANRKYRCGYGGPRWDTYIEPHFYWCRHVRRETVAFEARERAIELQRCFDRLGDFDDDAWEYRRR